MSKRAPLIATDSDEAAGALVNLILVLADNKWYLGLHTSEWAVGAPVLESGVACAAIAQLHMGQARVLYPLLEDLPSPVPAVPPGLEGTGRSRRYNVAYLDEPLPTWAHAVVALQVVDGAFNVLLESLRGSRHAQLARRVGRMLEEERFQRHYAEGRVRELCAFPGGRDLLQGCVERALPEMLAWFGPEGERGVEVLRAEGFLTHGNEQMRQRFLDRVLPVLLEVGTEVPVHRDGDRWGYEEPVWDDWNALQRRTRATARTPASR